MDLSRELLLKAARDGKLAKYWLGLSIASEVDVPSDCRRCSPITAKLILEHAAVKTQKMCDDFEENKARVRTALNPLVFFPASGSNPHWETPIIKDEVGEPRSRKTWNSQKKGINW